MEQLILQILDTWSKDEPLLRAYLLAASNAARVQAQEQQIGQLQQTIQELQADNVEPIDGDGSEVFSDGSE